MALDLTELRSARAESLYERHAAAADKGGWSVERDIRWGELDPALSYRRPEVLAHIRDAALIESFHPINLAQLLTIAWDDVDACIAFSLEGYEGFKHFHALRRYLDLIAYEPAITDDEIVEIRRSTATGEPPNADQLIERLVEFMLSEHLASYFFRRLSQQAAEPVLAELLRLIAADEVRHAQSASDLIANRIVADPAVVPRVLEASIRFRHFGERAIGPVPVALPGDPLAIQTFARRIERLCGVRLVDHLKTKL
jgi:hypothetical protein